MITLLIFLIVLSVLVFVHEFGHFITAKKSGVRVDEFGFGFPPRIFGWKRGETTYSVNWVPIGGFVKIKGESGEAASDRDSFASKSVGRRILIVAAGVIMNFVLAAVLLGFGFGLGLPSLVDGLPASARVRDRQVYVSDVLKETPAERAGLVAGDILKAIDGQPVETAEQFQQRIQSAPPGLSVTVEVDRGAERKSFTIVPEVLKETQKPGIGIGLVTTGMVSYPWYEAPYRGIEATVYLTGGIVRSLGDLVAGLFRGRVAVDFSGPVGIAVLTGEVARLGFASLIQFMALLSVNLAVINLVPFPALDGGRILFLCIEKLLGRPVPKRWENVAHQVGFALLIALIILITLRDLKRFLPF